LVRPLYLGIGLAQSHAGWLSIRDGPPARRSRSGVGVCQTARRNRCAPNWAQRPSILDGLTAAAEHMNCAAEHATVLDTLATLAYDDAREMLLLEFRSRATYQYFGGPAALLIVHRSPVSGTYTSVAAYGENEHRPLAAPKAQFRPNTAAADADLPHTVQRCLHKITQLFSAELVALEVGRQFALAVNNDSMQGMR
jgi:hypothetical protein